MATLQATFTNNYGQSRHWYIWDVGIDPGAPKLIFDGYLDNAQSTDPLTLYSDGFHATAQHQRSDGPLMTDSNISDRDNVSME